MCISVFIKRTHIDKMLPATRLSLGIMRARLNPAAIVATRSLPSIVRATQRRAVKVPLIPHARYFASSPSLAISPSPNPDLSATEHDAFDSAPKGEPDLAAVQKSNNQQVVDAEGITEEQEKQAELEPEHSDDATTSTDVRTEAPTIDDSLLVNQESVIGTEDESSPSGGGAAVITSTTSSGTPHSSGDLSG